MPSKRWKATFYSVQGNFLHPDAAILGYHKPQMRAAGGEGSRAFRHIVHRILSWMGILRGDAPEGTGD